MSSVVSALEGAIGIVLALGAIAGFLWILSTLEFASGVGTRRVASSSVAGAGRFVSTSVRTALAFAAPAFNRGAARAHRLGRCE